jgi:hypothetical protein
MAYIGKVGGPRVSEYLQKREFPFDVCFIRRGSPRETSCVWSSADPEKDDWLTIAYKGAFKRECDNLLAMERKSEASNEVRPLKINRKDDVYFVVTISSLGVDYAIGIRFDPIGEEAKMLEGVAIEPETFKPPDATSVLNDAQG